MNQEKKRHFMLLSDYLQKLGNIFFRWRSYIPLLLITILLLRLDNLKFVFGNNTVEIAYQITCLCVSFFGEFVRIMTIGFVPSGTSGRNTKAQRATTLNITGTYSLIRNPLYLGNYFIILGISLFSRSYEIVIINSIFFAMFYIPIILVEEKFLLDKFGESYRNYSLKTPCFFPRFSHWNPADTDWSWRMVIRREYNSILATGLSFALIAHFRLYLINGKAILGMSWIIFAGLLFLLWLIVRLVRLIGKYKRQNQLR